VIVGAEGVEVVNLESMKSLPERETKGESAYGKDAVRREEEDFLDEIRYFACCGVV
jgi:hypothetical protein